jgi:hypothetical protein
MLGQAFYHRTIRKYVAVFGTLFNDLYLTKRDSNDRVVSKIKVPVAYGPKQKFLTRLTSDPDLSNNVAITLPRIGFEMVSMDYDAQRKLNPTTSIVKRDFSTNTSKKMYTPVPYTFDFALYIFVDNAEDGTQLLEQILPFFTPEFTVSVNIITDMGLKLDVPIIINGASVEDTYEGEFTTRRAIIWTLNFTLKGYIYPDIKSGSKLIKSIDVSFKESLGDEIPSESLLEKILLEGSTNYNLNFLELESGTDFLVTENSDKALSRNSIISHITVVPDGDQSSDDQVNSGNFNTNTTITLFSIPKDFDFDTREYV